MGTETEGAHDVAPNESPPLTLGGVGDLPTSQLLTLAASILETLGQASARADRQLAVELRVRAFKLRNLAAVGQRSCGVVRRIDGSPRHTDRCLLFAQIGERHRGSEG